MPEAPDRSGDPAVHVLNPGGRDRCQSFAGGPGKPGDPGHPPVNFHAYAACTGGVFARDIHELPDGSANVVVLLRPRHLSACRKAVQRLRSTGCRVFVSWKESGTAQVASALQDLPCWKAFEEIALASDGFLSATPDLLPVYLAAGFLSGDFIPPPYPLEYPEWDFSRPLEERTGIFVGTREFDVPSRNHLLAILTALDLGFPVTVLNTSGARGRRHLESLSGGRLNIVDGPLPYQDYLKLMASHRIVYQRDASGVPGQVAGDALLCRMPCIGGNGAMEGLAFRELSAHCLSGPELASAALALMKDDGLWKTTVGECTALGTAAAGYHSTARKLREFFA